MLALAGCGSTRIDVENSAEPGASFGAYRTYGWVPLSDEAAGGMRMSDRRLRSEFIDVVDREMRRRGFSKVEVGQADLRIFVRGAAMQTAREIGQGGYFDTGYSRSGAGTTWLDTEGPTGYLEDETQAAVRLTMADGRTGNVVWRSRAVVGLKSDPSPAVLSARIRETAVRMLSGFPPNP